VTLEGKTNEKRDVCYNYSLICDKRNNNRVFKGFFINKKIGIVKAKTK
jgi:hypothetical protein